MAIIHCRPRDPFEDHDHALTTRCETNQTHARLSHGNESLILAGVMAMSLARTDTDPRLSG